MNRTVSVCIPIYNENENIIRLIDDILGQKQPNFTISEIIIADDGSTDNTVKNIKRLKNPKIKIISNKIREGLAARQNQLFKHATGDFLIILHADISIKDTYLFSKLLNPIMQNKADLVSGDLREISASSFINTILKMSQDYKREVFSAINNGDNFYTCHGPVRAFSKRLYQKINFKDSIGEDMYSYLYCKKNQFSYYFAKNAIVYYRQPNNLLDHEKQSVRFFRSLALMKKEFGKEFVSTYTKWPVSLLLSTGFKFFWQHPLYFCTYGLLTFYMSLKSKTLLIPNTNLWQIADSSKKLYPNSKKRVIFSSYDSIHHPSYGGGGAIEIHEVCKGLSNEFDILVLCGSYPGSHDEIIDTVKYKYIGVSFLGSRIGQLIYQFLLPWYITHLQFDIWIESFTPPFSSAFLPLFTKKPVIGLMHMLCGPDMKRKYYLPFDVFEKYCMKFYPRLIVTTNRIGNLLKSWTIHSKIYVIPNGITIPPNIKHTSNIHILYMGRIEIIQKGLDLLLQAYTLIKHKYQLPLLIAGTGNEDQIKLLKKNIQQLHLSRDIHCLGRISGIQKQLLFQNAACVVIPSRYETSSITALEALSYGKPLITFNIEGLKWIPLSLRYIAREITSPSLSQSIELALNKFVISKNYISDKRNFAKLYSIENTILKYKRLLLKIHE